METFKMLSGARPSNTHRDPSGKMGYNLGIKRNSKPQQNSKIAKETVLLTQASQSRTNQDNLKAKGCIHKPYGDLPHELGEHANDWNLVQRKTSENCQQLTVTVKATKDDELVRYMSNLPGYLQRVESIQDKALNVGVLDWGRLENWKCNQKGAPFGIGNNATLPWGNLSTKITRGSSAFSSSTWDVYGNRQHPSISGRNNSSRNAGDSRNAKSYIRDSMHFQDVKNATKRQFDEQKRAAWNYRSITRNSSNATSEKEKRRELDHKITSKVEHQPSNSKYDRMPIGPKKSLNPYDRVAKQRVEQLEGSDIKRKTSKQNLAPSIGTSSSKFGNYDSSPIIKEKKNANNSVIKKRIELQEPAIYLPPQHQVDKKKNIVLVPRKFSQSSSLKQPRMSLDENVIGANQNSLTEGFSDKESFSSELHHEIPHSCPLPSRVETGTKQEMAPYPISTQDAELSSDAINKSTRGNLDETSKKLEQETAELAARKGRHPSPNRRFSFSLSRMTRSFSFKESSAVPQLSSRYVSVKSGPVTSNAFDGIDNPNREKSSCHNRARSSPLRRILDPLLRKPKGITSSYSAETDQPLQGTPNSYSLKPIKVTESLQNEKHEASSTRAQLVLTTSNGFPLFRFVISDNIIVAAPVKNIMPPAKNDPGCKYVLYTIDEITKKSGSWINQSSKEKRCGFVYNVVGQMNVNSASSLDLSGKNSNSQYMVKESVLYGVELKQAEHASPKLMPNTELAAVVFKMPSGIEGYDMLHNDKDANVKANVKERGFSWCLPENEQNNSCTVILPGGIHSLPNSGVPSSLIQRWRSGGSCDCGGWDVGCKLRTLSNATQHQKLSKTYYDCLSSDCFELFVQGEPQQDRPIFSMAPFEKGKYSVEFSTSISLLQAFSICVSVISCQRSSDLPEVGSLSDEKALPESSTANDGPNTIWTTALKEAPVKYTPSPPVSPVGRA